MEWSEEKTLLLIELYRAAELLWDAKHALHFNKLKKHDAWEQIASAMETTAEECKRKMTAVLSSFRRERGKVSKSLGTGKGKSVRRKMNRHVKAHWVF